MQSALSLSTIFPQCFAAVMAPFDMPAASPHLCVAGTAGLLRVVRSVEGASWLDALLALWLAALRSVQRVSPKVFPGDSAPALVHPSSP